MNIELIKSLLIVAISSSIISTAFIQKVKNTSMVTCSNCIIYISFVVSFVIGILFTYSFTEYTIINALWVGLFSFLGADSIYKAFEDKIFTSYSSMKTEFEETEVIDIERE